MLDEQQCSNDSLGISHLVYWMCWQLKYCLYSLQLVQELCFFQQQSYLSWLLQQSFGQQILHTSNQQLDPRIRKHYFLTHTQKYYQNLYDSYDTYMSLTFPFPNVFVGVLTEMKMRSASIMAVLMSVEKKRFTPLRCFTTSYKPGWPENIFSYISVIKNKCIIRKAHWCHI